MKSWMLLLPIMLPICGAVLVFLTSKKNNTIQKYLALLFSAGSFVPVIMLFGKNFVFSAPWAGFGMDFELKLYNLNYFIMLAAAFFTFLTILYASVFMQGKNRFKEFFGFTLLGSGFITGAVLANNLVLMLFFWEGMLCMLCALIFTGGRKAGPAAIKALIINGAADLCLILGVCLSANLAATLRMDQINLPLNTFQSCFAFIMMMIGAIAKAGAMPFHSWIPDAASDAPLPVMAFLPGAMDKLLGIYLLVRISMDMFQLLPGSPLSVIMMITGSVTILFAVMMALIQKDFKRLLSFHAVSQVGYMILGIGTALPVGIIGGLFHMLNNAVYKSCLFFTAGAAERQTGSTDLKQLGGLGRKMPLTCTIFIIAALSIAGVPPLNGFFSKELIFDAALETNIVFYIIAVLGAFFTAASFLKLGHSVFFGKESEIVKNAKEAPWQMLFPAGILALACIVFGIFNALPLQKFIEPAVFLADKFAHNGVLQMHTYAGLPHNWLLTGISISILALAVLNHIFGTKKSGHALGAADHIHYAPVLKTIYKGAETGLIDPYNIGKLLMRGFTKILYAADKGIDWIYSRLMPGIASYTSKVFVKLHTGRHWLAVLWMLAGAAIIAFIFIAAGG